MGSDDDDEEILVYVEFEGLVDSNVFNEKQLQLDMIGIDTEYPIMQINGRFYEGAYEDVCGTHMFFTKDDNPAVDDPVFDAAPNLKYFGKTRKCLKMRRIFIKPRTEVLGDSEHQQCIPNLNTLKQAGIPFQYQKEALSFWETVRNNRLNALHSYLEKQRIRQQQKSEGIELESESDEDNPFAMYNHKEEASTLNKSEDNCVNLDKESNYCDNQSHSEDICQNNFNPETLAEPESSILKNDNGPLLRRMKTHKTKVVCKRKINIAGNKQRKKFQTKRSLLEDEVSSSNAKVRALSDKKEADVEAKSDITKILNSLEIAEHKN
ncbi:uncharacterized protein LOC117610747 [Osmia lignaria lignaria]|uniref:uncharacterized protein LOC117610747 n=1 Tax=Osmia lignaria lignaria TaxID=1437193 RepID=UPI0014788AC1|nr:general transcription factor 3C polypeptide 6 [Osmia lignaria]